MPRRLSGRHGAHGGRREATHPLSSRVLRPEGGGFFLGPGGRAVQVAVFAFLEKVGEAGTFVELQMQQKKKDFFFYQTPLARGKKCNLYVTMQAGVNPTVHNM